MADRESVITHLQIIHTWAEFAREHDLQFFTAKHLEDIAKWSDDALALLKEQEAVEPFSDDDGGYWCGSCHEDIVWHQKFCSNCGKPVLWEGR